VRTDEIPQKLIDILDRMAGKKHSREGSVVKCLAEILTEYDAIRSTMKTELRLEGRDKVYTYDLDLPLIPENTFFSLPQAAGARIVSTVIRVNDDETIKQYLVAR